MKAVRDSATANNTLDRTEEPERQRQATGGYVKITAAAVRRWPLQARERAVTPPHRRRRSGRYRPGGGVNQDTCAATMRQPSGRRIHVCIWRPGRPESSLRNSVLAVATSRP